MAGCPVCHPSVTGKSCRGRMFPRADAGDQVSWFTDLGEFVAIPRVTSLCLSPDGTWLAAAVQTLGPEPKKFGTSVWRIGTGQDQPVRLTRSGEGESAPAFLADGSLLFASKRPEPGPGTPGEGDDAKPGLWRLGQADRGSAWRRPLGHRRAQHAPLPDRGAGVPRRERVRAGRRQAQGARGCWRERDLARGGVH